MKTIIIYLISALWAPEASHAPKPVVDGDCYEFDSVPVCEVVEVMAQELTVCCDAAQCAVFWSEASCRLDTCCGDLACPA
jgi:hypothetical protein